MVLDDTVHEPTFKHVNWNGMATSIPLGGPFNDTLLNRTQDTLLSKFIETHKELLKFRNHSAVEINGHSLHIAGVVAAARHGALVRLDDSKLIRDAVNSSRQVVIDKVKTGASIYGLSTGFGGSADTRTNKPLVLGHALLQHQHIGVLPTSDEPISTRPLQDPSSTTTMPESWVRAAILIRMNSLIRGHSGVRWELIEKLNELLSADAIPVIPLRGSISASGDLSPLSYIAGALVGNPSIQLYHGPHLFGPRQKAPSGEVLGKHSIEPIDLGSKEHLGLVNGTSVSAAVAVLAIDEAMHLLMIAQICTAMATEALGGTLGSFAPFIHSVARPHPGQVECAQNIWNLLQGSKLARLHEDEVNLEEDRYLLRQDRYALRTAPQFLGPQIEDILTAFSTLTQECNSTTDNPLIESGTGTIHHGGNFQAMSVTNSMEKTRLSLHHIGKILFAQSTELCNPAMNNGLPPSLAASDPSLNYHGKGVDIATASYVAELGFLATPVSTHIQSAEMHNQAVNSLALISARATITSLDVLSMLIASYIYLLCQALDLRTLRLELVRKLKIIIREEISSTLGLLAAEQDILYSKLLHTMSNTFDKTTIMDSVDQMRSMAASAAPVLLNFFDDKKFDNHPSPSLSDLRNFCLNIESKATDAHMNLRKEFLSGSRGPAPASSELGKTRRMYEFVRKDLCVKMHGLVNHEYGDSNPRNDVSIGQNISKIYESIRDGRMLVATVSTFV